MLDKTQPLGLPKGSVRAVIALVTISGFLALMILDRPVPEHLTLLVGAVTGFYFGNRANEATNKP